MEPVFPRDNSLKFKRELQDLQHNSRKIEDLFCQAVHAALLQHKQAGNSVVGVVDGDIVWVQPDDILTEKP